MELRPLSSEVVLENLQRSRDSEEASGMLSGGPGPIPAGERLALRERLPSRAWGWGFPPRDSAELKPSDLLPGEGWRTGPEGLL